MKMKKIIAMALCAIITCFCLAGCAEQEIGSYLDHYDWEPETIIDLNYDLYIITESDDSDEAKNSMTTVEAKINQIIDDKYHTTINIHYLTEEEYFDTVKGVADSWDEFAPEALKQTGNGLPRFNAGAIVLIAGSEMYDYLVGDEENTGKLVDLYPYLNEKEHITDFGTLNTQLTPTVVAAANDNGKLYFLPNEHVVGNYEYTIVNRDIAEGILNFSAQSEIYEMKIVDGVPNEIAEELIVAYQAQYPDGNVEDVIRVETGMYEDKAAWESKEDVNYICNISKYPEVSLDDVCDSGFGILNSKDIVYKNETIMTAAECNKRAMEVVYSINANSEVRNLLQYGVEYTNYTLVERTEKDKNGNDIVVKYVVPYEENAYKMNLLYTGDAFNAYFCDEAVYFIDNNEFAWTYKIYLNGDSQNSESVIKK